MCRVLIVNADDFGLSSGVNRGIVRAHSYGIVTSTSLMVRWPAAPEAVELARQHPNLAIGLHLDLGEWKYCQGEWISLYEVVPLDDPDLIAEETKRQLAKFREMVGRDPTHLDSHQHVHLEDPVRSVAVHMARDLGVPLRRCGSPAHYCGNFYGQTAHGEPLPDFIGVEALIDLVANLPTGITELACHPGEVDDLDGMYRDERAREVRTLCDPSVREFLDRECYTLSSFAEIADVGASISSMQRRVQRVGPA